MKPVYIFFIAALLCVFSSCKKEETLSIDREDLFSLDIGRLEDQLGLYDLQDDRGRPRADLAMRDGFFYITDAIGQKVVQFNSFGQLLFMIYNIDLALKSTGLLQFIKKMHQFYCELFEKWAKTDMDALNMMDDWGTQRSLLIHPDTWVEIFKPLYRDYIEIAHRAGKKMFMHSDGHTLAIYPHLIELGLDAFNSQIFCMGIENLEPFKGKITFWGEVDRQHLLPNGTVDDIHRAITQIKNTLWQDGGCIAQCEFGAGAKPENVRQVFASWDELTGKDKL